MKHYMGTSRFDFQHALIVACVVFLTLLYFAGAVRIDQLRHMATHSKYPTSGYSPATSSRLAYAPDIAPPSVQAGKAPVLSRVHTSQPVVFLTIDDGVDRAPDAADTLRDLGIPASLFLVEHYAKRAPPYFAHVVQESGSVIEDHTLDHPNMLRLNYDQQKQQICETADSFMQHFGRRPTLFRPPYGNFNDDTQRAATACGMRAILYWHALVEDGVVKYQDSGKLLPGDIVLMHFKPNFRQDAEAFLAASRAAGLQPQLLEDWIWE
jgi:peptidoglycan/xylan/chitin deacetylase (PgdA/CDA1 family)